MSKALQNKKACLNIKKIKMNIVCNGVCWQGIPAKNHSSRVSSYPSFRDVLKTKGMLLPVTFAEIRAFEKK